MAESGPPIVELAISGPIGRDDLAELCERICTLLRSSGAQVAVCDVRGTEPDVVTVEALARLRLAALRTGCQVRLRHVSAELAALVTFMGLADVFHDRESAHPWTPPARQRRPSAHDSPSSGVRPPCDGRTPPIGYCPRVARSSHSGPNMP